MHLAPPTTRHGLRIPTPWLLIFSLACSLWACGDLSRDRTVGGTPPGLGAMDGIPSIPPEDSPITPGSSLDQSAGSGRGFQKGAGPMAGYTLMAVQSASVMEGRSTLIDMTGKVIRQWSSIGFPSLMLPTGHVLGVKKFRDDALVHQQESIDVVIQDWNDKDVWTFSNWDADGTGKMMARQHHDYQVEGNPVGYYAPGQKAALGGKLLVLSHATVKVPKISSLVLTDDVIYEVTAGGKLGSFKWQGVDHFDEIGFDATAKDEIKTNPTVDPVTKKGDWLHLNAMSELGRNHWYEQSNDQRFHPNNILISSREGCFIAIISRQTGKLVWKIGPTYGAGTPGEHVGPLIGQHHAHMIPHGLPGAGNILVFDNGGVAGYGDKYVRSYSRVVEIDPVALKVAWQYDEKLTGGFLSVFIGGAQRLPNGNTLITNGYKGHVFEVTREKKKVWEYTWPMENNAIYRAYRIPPEWIPDVNLSSRYAFWN